MQGLVIHGANDLRIEDLPTPELGTGQLRVRVRCGGICGSDLHYMQHGGFGTVRVKEPMVLGHEVAGVITAVGAAVAGFAAGERVAISPSRPCSQCRFCQLGLQNHCLDMRYYGSAMRTPHVQGAFRQDIVIEPYQAHRLADSVSDGSTADITAGMSRAGLGEALPAPTGPSSGGIPRIPLGSTDDDTADLTPPAGITAADG